jgi:hypothetical protein
MTVTHLDAPALQLATHVDKSGRLDLKLPPEFAGRDVVVEVMIRRPAKRRANTPEEYQQFLDGILGACDDPTFVPPPDQPVPPIEPL